MIDKFRNLKNKAKKISTRILRVLTFLLFLALNG